MGRQRRATQSPGPRSPSRNRRRNRRRKAGRDEHQDRHAHRRAAKISRQLGIRHLETLQLSKVESIDIEQARRASGLRIVTLARVPSPWGEALKGILHIKQLPHARVSHVFGTPTQTLLEWTGQDSFPVLAWNDERPLTRWIDQINLAERLAPTPRLIPEKLEDRVLMFGYSNELCGENGIGWFERLRGVHEAVTKPGGDPAGISAYLGKKYGYTPEIGARAA